MKRTSTALMLALLLPFVTVGVCLEFSVAQDMEPTETPAPGGRGDDCSSNDCRRPFVCAPRVKECVKPQQLGESCGRAREVCGRNLVCTNKDRCRRKRLGQGSPCNPRRDECPSRLFCVGRKNKNKTRCFRRRREGESCVTPFEVCDRSLMCDGDVCVVRKTMLGSPCNKPFQVCPGKQSCEGRKGNKKCVRLRKLREDCGRTPFQVCAKGLKCKNRKCRKA